MQLLGAIARALSIKLIKVKPPDMALWMLDTCVAASKQKHEFRWGANGIKFGDADNPGPFFVPLQSCVESALRTTTVAAPPPKRKKASLSQCKPMLKSHYQAVGLVHRHQLATSSHQFIACALGLSTLFS
jgi:hypothetical protein